MKTRIFLAGATGAIGMRLIPLLIDSGYEVTGTTRNPDKTDMLEQAGVETVIVDVLDATALTEAVTASRANVIMHQLTDLTQGSEPDAMAQAILRNAHVRTVGTGNLVAAAKVAGIDRIIAQSIAWVYAPKDGVLTEEDGLDLEAPAPRSVSIQGVVALEDAVLNTPGINGIVLRYGRLYGPRTGAEVPDPKVAVHVDAAAYAALLALANGKNGIYNIAETDALVTSAKARRELGWDPAFRLPS